MNDDRKDPDRFAKALLKAFNSDAEAWDRTDEEYRRQYRKAAANVLALAEYQDLRFDPQALRLRVLELRGLYTNLQDVETWVQYITTGKMSGQPEPMTSGPAVKAGEAAEMEPPAPAKPTDYDLDF